MRLAWRVACRYPNGATRTASPSRFLAASHIHQYRLFGADVRANCFCLFKNISKTCCSGLALRLRIIDVRAKRLLAAVRVLWFACRVALPLQRTHRTPRGPTQKDNNAVNNGRRAEEERRRKERKAGDLCAA
jgi:hypothetical protein